jgi:hypothetical protein
MKSGVGKAIWGGRAMRPLYRPHGPGESRADEVPRGQPPPRVGVQTREMPGVLAPPVDGSLACPCCIACICRSSFSSSANDTSPPGAFAESVEVDAWLSECVLAWWW